MERIYNYYPANISIPGDAKISARNLDSPRTGAPVANQFVIRVGFTGIIRFQYYNSTCMMYDYDCKILTVFPAAFGYSRITSKYSKIFLMEEIGLPVEQVEEISKMAKKEDFGSDCPLYIQL